jgi:hypothetical protein
MQSRWKTTLVAVGLCTLTTSVGFADHHEGAKHTALAPADLTWVDAPPSLPKGAKIAVLYGDPTKPGMFIIRAKFPAKYKVMPHWHPGDENVTVISGGLAIGMGDTVDPKTKVLPAGSFFSMPAKMHHYAFTKRATVIEVAGTGPFAVNYINPADDPSKAAAPPTKAETPAKAAPPAKAAAPAKSTPAKTDAPR